MHFNMKFLQLLMKKIEKATYKRNSNGQYSQI